MAERISTKKVSEYLRELSGKIHADAGVNDDGTPISRAQALAELLWREALGGEVQDPDNPQKVKRVVPKTWAIQLVYERLEGKVPNAAPEEKHGITVTDRVREMAKDRLNKIAKAAAGAPPSYKGK